MTTHSYKEQATGKETADLTALLDRNRSVAEQFEAGDLPIRPHMSTIILTCVDARVDPAHIFEHGIGRRPISEKPIVPLDRNCCRRRRLRQRSRKNWADGSSIGIYRTSCSLRHSKLSVSQSSPIPSFATMSKIIGETLSESAHRPMPCWKWPEVSRRTSKPSSVAMSPTAQGPSDP